ncbi:MAG: type IV pilus twitching motility protein PilT [Chthoniobacterales bacterium]
MNKLLSAILEFAVENKASDVLLHEGSTAAFKIGGEIIVAEMPSIEKELITELWALCNAKADALDHDGAFESEQGARFRANLFHYLGHRGAVLRRIESKVPDFETLGLPSALFKKWLSRSSGLFLVCGPTGSGKSSTLASCVDYLNASDSKHIVTVEDPVEFLFKPQRSIITQREVGIDVPTFDEGLRRALRQAPDIIFVGEIRDYETASMALQASETGHLVLSSMHVSQADEAVERFSIMFPSAERDAVASVLARELIAVFVQRLLPTTNNSLTLALEYFTNEGAVSDLLTKRDREGLADLFRRDPIESRRSLNASLAELVQRNVITEDIARKTSPEPGDLSRALRGII